jgi:hypothetical protein
MHGGARGSGAPAGNVNALKHGLQTQQAVADRKALNDLIRRSTEVLKQFE